ncbi:hypothetical protein [Vibrio sinaloensis]|uniref:hypothetical protein n=1 Tax=Photobacterium sp. (strain ATCC 43367) TaxID=379097 RepID=UPI002F3F7BC4
MNTQRTVLAMAVAIGLTACGGGGGSSDPDPTAPATSSFTARAADGYLEGARACLDLNANKACDADEPSAVTDENGEFTLTNLTAQQRQNGVVVIEVVPGQTIDQDNPGTPLTKAYTLTAPPGSEFVSPLTTLVQNEVEKGKSLEDAKAVVKGQLGSLGGKVDLEQDYVAAKASSTMTQEEREAYMSLHKVAQVAASVMANATDSLDASKAGIEDDELKELIIEQVMQVVDDVLSHIGNAEDDIDIDKILEELPLELAQENLKDKLDELDAVKNSEDVDLLKVLKSDGLVWFDSYAEDYAPPELEFGAIRVNKESEVEELQFFYDYQTGDFEQHHQEPGSEDGQMLLSAEGWVAADDTVVEVVSREDGSVLVKTALSELNQEISADRINISNLNVREILEDADDSEYWLDHIDSDLVFPVNSVAYKVESSMVEEGYYGFNKGDWCEKYDPDRYQALGNMCNGISAGGVWLKTLASTIAVNDSDRSGTHDTADLIPLAGTSHGILYAQLTTVGDVVYYAYQGEEALTKFAAQGSWQDIEHKGQTLREITLPEAFEDEVTWSDFNREDNKLYLAVYNDFVRVTWYVDGDEAEGDEYLFGSTAAEFIVSSYQPFTLQACLDSLSDADYEKQVGDTWVQNVTRNMSWVGHTQHWTYHLEHMGDNFSWLADSNVTDLPAQYASGALTQTRVKGYDEANSVVFVEAQYEDQDHYYGQIGRDESGNSWGNVKVVLPTPVAKSELLLGKTVEHEDAAVASLTQVTEAAEGTLVEQLQSEYFTYTQQFLGKRSIEVAAGEFDVCHMVSYTHWGAGAANPVTDKNVVWLNNRGVVKQERDDPSWGAQLDIEVASLPEIDD